MDTNIYYTPEDKGVTITNDFAEIKKWMDLGVNPKVDYIPISIADFSKYEITELGFRDIENEYFQTIKEIFTKLKLEAISFYRSTIDLSGVTIDAQHLIIGDKSKVNIGKDNFKNLEEVTFLSVKSFKGKVLDKFETVKKLVLWDSTKTSALPEMFPNIEELTVNRGGIIELDLRNNKDLEKLDIHLCSKLESILLPENNKLTDVMIENCKNLDISNLPTEITRVWPPRKEKKETGSAQQSVKSTGNQHIDSLILDLKKNMEDYMNEFEPSYSQEDVNECISILSEHAIKVLKTKSSEEGLALTKATVLKLNELNEKCDFGLIETNEREQIAEIIILSGSEMGYNSADEDITEEWREW